MRNYHLQNFAESAFLDSWVERASQPFFAMIKKDENVPDNRAYVFPLKYLPEDK
jgi:hypothetical protein